MPPAQSRVLHPLRFIKGAARALAGNTEIVSLSTMATRPGPLGMDSNPGVIDPGTCARTQNRPPGPTCVLNPTEAERSQQAPPQSTPAKEKSGASWVNKFPGSTSTDDLDPVFRDKVKKFLAAIADAGGSVAIAATYRPRERAYLMHYSSKVSRGDIEAAKVPAMAGVDIEWVHASEEASKKAASAMAKAFGIVYPPALISRHTERCAIDMTVSGIVGKKIKNASNEEVEIKKLSDLNAVGASYGVNKLVSDPPHWSDDGH